MKNKIQGEIIKELKKGRTVLILLYFLNYILSIFVNLIATLYCEHVN